MLITGKRNNAVLISEDDWKSVQENIYLLSVPGMRESIVAGMNAPDSEFLSLEEFRAALEQEGDEAP